MCLVCLVCLEVNRLNPIAAHGKIALLEGDLKNADHQYVLWDYYQDVHRAGKQASKGFPD